MMYELTFHLALGHALDAQLRPHPRGAPHAEERRGAAQPARGGDGAVQHRARRLRRSGDPDADPAGREPGRRAPRPAGAVDPRADAGRTVQVAVGRTARDDHPRADADRHLRARARDRDPAGLADDPGGTRSRSPSSCSSSRRRSARCRRARWRCCSGSTRFWRCRRSAAMSRPTRSRTWRPRARAAPLPRRKRGKGRTL